MPAATTSWSSPCHAAECPSPTRWLARGAIASGGAVVLIDDGLATGSTMRAAVRAVEAQNPARVVVAVPVGAPSTCAELGREADEVVCLERPEHFAAVGHWYDDFSQTSDEEVQALLT